MFFISVNNLEATPVGPVYESSILCSGHVEIFRVAYRAKRDALARSKLQIEIAGHFKHWRSIAGMLGSHKLLELGEANVRRRSPMKGVQWSAQVDEWQHRDLRLTFWWRRGITNYLDANIAHSINGNFVGFFIWYPEIRA